ncbi:hypothetical protein B0H14DRAFT_3502766 [Mycena olivaceomarginata]|nr:hypothetical protein B0H14DRAFT_3502766 [Mycena olivaceomarginata]
MAITRNTSARTPSPTPSDSSDIYYEGYNNISSPAPSQAADLYGWESDLSPAPMDSETTPTPQAARPSSPASAAATAPTSDADDPFLAADIVAATAASLGLPTLLDHATEKASSSRRPTVGPGSPSKRRHSNTACDTSPAPAPMPTPAVASAAAPIAAPAAAFAASWYAGLYPTRARLDEGVSEEKQAARLPVSALTFSPRTQATSSAIVLQAGAPSATLASLYHHQRQAMMLVSTSPCTPNYNVH